RCVQARQQRGAVSTVGLMNDMNPGVAGRCFIEQRRSPIARSIVDDDELGAGHVIEHVLLYFIDGRDDRALLVVDGHDDAQAIGFRLRHEEPSIAASWRSLERSWEQSR